MSQRTKAEQSSEIKDHQDFPYYDGEASTGQRPSYITFPSHQRHSLHCCDFPMMVGLFSIGSFPLQNYKYPIFLSDTLL